MKRSETVFGIFLQMKNIITWTEPNEAFRNRLRNLLRYIIRPLLREQQSISLQVNQSRRFSLLSQDERLKALLKKATDFLRAHSYQLCELSRKGPWARYYDHVNLQKVFHDTLYRVFVLIRPFVNKLSFQGFEGGLPLWLFTSLTKEELHKLKNIESVWIVVSLRNVRAATLPTILPDWKPITDYIFKKDKVKDLQEEVPHSATVAVLDAVRSVEDFSDRFRSLIVEMEKETSKNGKFPDGSNAPPQHIVVGVWKEGGVCGR